jgi:hypothetical protein
MKKREDAIMAGFKISPGIARSIVATVPSELRGAQPSLPVPAESLKMLSRACIHKELQLSETPAAPEFSLDKRKKKLLKSLSHPKKAARAELDRARKNIYLVIVAFIITAALAVIAHIFSDLEGVISTLLGGGSGSCITLFSVRESVTSYTSLKADIVIKIEKFEYQIEIAKTGDDLDNVEKEISAFFGKLGTHGKIMP